MLILINTIFGYLALIWHFLFQDLALDPRQKNLATLERERLVLLLIAETEIR